MGYSRYKPVGWRNESHRHYLAAKGIRTRYFVRHELKGNRESGVLHSLYARGYSKPEIRSLGIPVPEKRTNALVDIPDASQVPFASEASGIPLPQESIPVQPEPENQFRLEENQPSLMAGDEQSATGSDYVDTTMNDEHDEKVLAAEEAAKEARVSSSEKNVAEAVPGNVVMTPGVPEPTEFGFSL